MKSKTGELSVRKNTGGRDSNEVDEIELYSDLASFSQLSPEEQEALAAPAPEVEETEKAEEAALPERAEPAPAPARMGTGDLLRAFTSFADAALAVNSAKARASTCPSCGCESDSLDLFCMECGEFFDEPVALETPSGQASPISGLACTDCREIIAEGEIFCPSCGAVL